MDLTEFEVRFLRTLQELLEDSPQGSATVAEVLSELGVEHRDVADSIDKLQQRDLIGFGGNNSLSLTTYGEKVLDEIDAAPVAA